MDLRKKGLIRSESGIIEKNGIYFHTVSGFAMQNLFYALWGANYLCRAPYIVNRQGFNIFLLFYIEKGALYFEYRGKKFTARENDVVLLDCTHHHLYYASDDVRFSWFHFHGAASSAYCELLWENFGALFNDMHETKESFLNILNLLNEDSSADDRISIEIHSILSRLNKSGHIASQISPQIIKAQQWIDAHFKEDISIDDAASHVSMTRYYFSRRFKAESGISPHDYLINKRIAYAKERLANHTDSIEQIAFDCAFSSSSNFIRAFKSKTGMTPYKFRAVISVDNSL